jgi:hypothetical protein
VKFDPTGGGLTLDNIGTANVLLPTCNTVLIWPIQCNRSAHPWLSLDVSCEAYMFASGAKHGAIGK